MATVRKHRGSWVADYRDQWGKRHRERPDGKFENMAQQRRAAQVLLKRRLDEVDRGSYHPDNRKLTFAKVADAYLESKVGIRPSTRRGYSSNIELYLKPYFGQWRIQHISAADIEAFRNALLEARPPPIEEAFARREMAQKPALSLARAKARAGRTKPGPRTINKCLTLLVMIFNYAAKHRWVDFNPAGYVDKVRESLTQDSKLLDQNILSAIEVRRLVDAATGPRRSRDGRILSTNYKLLIKLSVLTGMRSGEIRGLQWGDIDWNKGRIHVRRSYREGCFEEPKTRASRRVIGLPMNLQSDLRDWQVASPISKCDLVFPNSNGNPLSAANLLQRGFYPALRRAGLRKIRFHDLRHTFASLMIASGVDIVSVSRLLGHASPKITLDVYAHMLPSSHLDNTKRLSDVVFSVDNTDRDSTALTMG